MKKFRFTKSEIKEIALALIVLVFIFSLRDLLVRPSAAAYFLAESFFAIGLAFMGHELAHKYMANKLGYTAHFQIWREGILMALLLAVATGGSFFFAAPGAVVFAATFSNPPTKRKVGKIGIAGPAFNLAASPLFLAIYAASSVQIFWTAAFINTWLALFNMIPINPLDGGKVIAWSKLAWFATVVLAIAELALVFY